MGSNVKRSGHSTSRRQRSRRQAPRKPKTNKRSLVVSDGRTVDHVQPTEKFTTWKDVKFNDQDPPVPIKQTGSWKLVPISAQLWFKNANTSLTILFLPIVSMLLGLVLTNGLQRIDNWTLFGLILTFASLCWQIINIPPSYYLQVQVAKGNHPGVIECYRQGLRITFRLVGLVSLVMVLAVGGLILFIIPGVIVIRRYLLSPFYLIDQNLGIREAMQRSAAESKMVSQYIWGVYAVYFSILFITTILFIKIFPPYGSLAASFLTGLFTFGPALRYREIALRKPATELIQDESLTF